MKKPISGFSKLNKSEKIEWLSKNSFSSDINIKNILLQYCNSNEKLQNFMMSLLKIQSQIFIYLLQ